MADHDEIDAGAVFDAHERGDSGLHRHKRPNPPGARAFLIVCCFVVVGAFLFVTYKGMGLRDGEEGEAEQVAEVALNKDGASWRPAEPAQRLDQTQPEPQDEAETEQVASREPAETVITEPSQQAEGPSPEELIRMRRLQGGMNKSGGQGGGAAAAAYDPGSVDFKPGNNSELAKQLQPVRLDASMASVLKNRDMLLTQGAMIDCQLETKIISTIAGMTTCYTTRNVLSTNKRVVLIDKGSKVVGQFQGGMTQGQARIFVLWTRVETPNGVVINLDSPGAGPLGESGVGGWVDNHFFQRFSGAIFLSLIGDVGDMVSRSQQNTDGGITFDNTADGAEDMAAEALRNSINIPPTLYKNQGERVKIFVARDLDFSGVYALERK